MPAPVVIEFLLRGMPAIDRAFKSVEQAAAASDRAQTNIAQRGARQRQSAVEKEAQAKVRAMMKMDREVKRIHDKLTREAERAAQHELRVEERKEQAIIRAREKRSREVERRNERDARNAQRWAERQLQNEQRAAQRMEQVRQRREQREQHITERNADYDRRRFARSMAGHVVSGAARGVSQVAQTTARVGGMFAQLGGGFSVADAVQQRGNIEREAALLSNQAFIPNRTARPGAKAIMAQAKATSAATGMDMQDVIAGTRRFVNLTGNYQAAAANQEFFAKVAKATGAQVTDIAGTAGMLMAQNQGMKPEEMRETLLRVMMQANLGAVGVEDLARVGGKLTKTSANYSGSQTDTQRRLLGLAQVGITTGGNPAETQTMIAKLSSDAIKNRKNLESMMKAGGVTEKTFDEKGRIATTPEELLVNALQASGGRTDKLQGVFKERSIKLFQALQPKYFEYEQEAKDKGITKDADVRKYARDQTLKYIEGITAKSYGEENLNKDVEEVLASGSEQFEKAMRDLRTEVGEKLIPEFVKLIPTLKELTPMLVEALKVGVPAFIKLLKQVGDFAKAHEGIIKSIAANPVGAIIAANVGASIAQAGLAEVLRAGVARALAAQVGGQVVGQGVAGSTAAGVPMGTRVGAATGGSVLGYVGAGIALQGALAYNEGSRIAGDDKAAQDAIDRAAKGDATAVPNAIAAAQGRRGAGAATQATITDVSRMANYINPLAIAGMFASDYVTKQVTGKDPMAVQQSADYHNAGAELQTLGEAPKIIAAQQKVADESKALADALKENTAAVAAVARQNAGLPPGGAAAGTGIVQRPTK